MTAVHPDASRQAVVEAALVLLERMGLSPADLAAVPQHRPPVPTFAEYVPVVSAAVSAGTRRAYGSYWNRVVEHWGDRRLDEPTPSDIRQLMSYVKTHVVARRNARGGRSAEEHLVAALRCLYQRAVDDRLIAEADNPARKVAKPRRLPTTRRALPDTRLAEINEVAAATGDDPELDTLLLRLHTETACRRGGALALRPRDLDPDQCLVLLREKGETVRWQPVSPTLMGRLIEHGQERHAPADGPLLRYADGRPITSRRYDHLWTRIGRHLPWVADPGHQHPLDSAHDLDVGRAELRLRRRHAPTRATPTAAARRARHATYVRASLARGRRRAGRADRRAASARHARKGGDRHGCPHRGRDRPAPPRTRACVVRSRCADQRTSRRGPVPGGRSGRARTVRSWPLLTEGPLPGSRRLAGCGRYVTCLLRDVYCAGCCWRSTVSASVIVIADAPQVPPVTARFLQDPFSEVQDQFCGAGGYPGRTDRRQGLALRAPHSELTTASRFRQLKGCLPTE